MSKILKLTEISKNLNMWRVDIVW